MNWSSNEFLLPLWNTNPWWLAGLIVFFVVPFVPLALKAYNGDDIELDLRSVLLIIVWPINLGLAAQLVTSTPDAWFTAVWVQAVVLFGAWLFTVLVFGLPSGLSTLRKVTTWQAIVFGPLVWAIFESTLSVLTEGFDTPSASYIGFLVSLVLGGILFLGIDRVFTGGQVQTAHGSR